MQDKIAQGSQEWLDARQSKIGGSEIFSLVLHYCKKELEAMGFDLKEEKSFRTVQELFLKVKFGAKLSEIDPIHSQFGNGLEPYVAYRLHEELPELQVERSKDFIINEDLHPLAACSPDGFIEINEEWSIPDFDKTCEINSSWGRGALELKTANYFANFGSEKGSRLNYIFQNQFQMMVLGLKWGCLAVLMPKEKEFDDPFFKGQILERLKWTEGTPYFHSDHEDNVNKFYDLKYYIYPQLPAFQAMIIKSLNAFQADLDAYEAGDQTAFPRNSEDLAGLQREKAMWAQLWPEHDFGSKQLTEEDELNEMLNERYKYQEAEMFAKQDLAKINNEIFQKVKASGFDKFCEIRGVENRLMWDKNGVVRFYKINNKKEK